VLGERVAVLLCACGLSRGASSIGELRWRDGRFMHSSPASLAQSTANPRSQVDLPAAEEKLDEEEFPEPRASPEPFWT